MKDNNSNNKSLIFTRETLGMVILLCCFILLLALLSGSAIFAGFGSAICTLMYGTFGYGSFLILALVAYLGEWLVFEKKLNLYVKPTILLALTVYAVFLLFHAVSTRNFTLDGSYISYCYTVAGDGFPSYTFGGVISAILVYPVASAATFVGSYIIFSILIVAGGYFTVQSIRKNYFGHGSGEALKKQEVEEEKNPAGYVADNAPNEYETPAYVPQDFSGVYQDSHRYVQPQYLNPRENNDLPSAQDAPDDRFSPEKIGRQILFGEEFAAESYRRNGIFDKNSYFNRPTAKSSDQTRGFSVGKDKSQGAVSENGGSRADDSFSRAGNSSSSGGLLYGDTPASSLSVDPTPAPSYGGSSEYVPPRNIGASPSGDYASGTDRPQSSDLGQNRDFVPPREQAADSSREYNGLSSLNDMRSRSYNQDDELPSSRISTPSGENEALSGAENTYSSSTRAGFGAANTDADDDATIEKNENISRRESIDLSGAGDISSRRREIFSEDNGADEKEEDKNSSSNDIYSLFSSSNSRLGENRVEPDISRLSSRRESRSNLFDEDVASGSDAGDIVSGRISRAGSDPGEIRTPDFSRERPAADREQKQSEPVQPAPPAEEKKPPHVWKKYIRPSLDLLDDYPEYASVNTGEIEDNKRIIVDALTNFGISSEVANVVIGPSITRYDVIIHDRTKESQSIKHRDSIAMALKKDSVNAYLNYSQGALSIEVPNSKRSTVGLKTMLTSPEYINCKRTTLTFGLGKNVEGMCVCPDITKMPHLLVAGTTGSGKSICLSALLISLLYKYGPEDLRLILVDPKQVEFISYDKLPHLMINEIIYDVDKAIKALNWAIKEMERRYALFKEMTETGAHAKGGQKIATKDVNEYNSHLEDGEEKLAKIIIVLDEFGDLMLQSKKEIESRIIRLVQKARACGIHLILATQRPSVDCITGLIKSNLPTRIGFKVGSSDDSRTIFDIGGAEKLLGKGDMYFRSAEKPELVRIQGCFVDTPEVQRVTDFIKQNNETYFDESVSDFINKVEEPETSGPVSDGVEGGDEGRIDDSYIKALKFCVEANGASVSMIQRRFPVGYIKACKIIDWMENMNYVTKSEGSKQRKVLLSKDEFINTYGDIDD